ncbi:elongation factor G [Actinomarinicola tropica]|uniref:Elongation factor G n=1 Tax=Actinomarinicola tropica TaxID=2789776 RepID=A0A5Q2RNM4_9ACTN|nr:elongation factor G [Actinomarinicola tropica]QGG96191.1 elongation factor G [Actinomarinicola tropica]
MATTERIRNVALVGHSGAGTTSLTEAALLAAGAIGRLGRVEDGTTVADTDPEEKAHGLSLALSVVPVEWKGHLLNLVDTPGDPDLEGEVRAALRVADLAVLVVSGVDGVQVGTESAWRLCAEADVPVLVFVNKLDRERASFDRTLDQLKERFGEGIEPLELPIGAEAGFSGVADVLTEKAYLYDQGKGSEAEVPADLAEREHQVHDEVVESIVVGDDTMLERFLDGDEPALDELERTLEHEIVERTAFPVLEGSATTGVGIDRLCDYLCEIGPPPTDRAVDGITVDPSGPTIAFVFKTVADPYVGQVSIFKVLSGTVRNDDHLRNARSGGDERIHGLFRLRGDQQTPVAELVAGDIGGVAKLADTRTGDVLSVPGTDVDVAPIAWPEPVHTVAVVARTQADEDKLATAIHRLADEDPTLRLDHDDETHQTLLRGTGETHLNVSLERLERKFGVRVDVEPVKVAYRETITTSASAEGRYKKQSGGHGQFGVASLVVEPCERGAGFEFVDEVVGGAIPRQFIPAVERGVRDTMDEGGVLRGYPVVDVRVRCVDGKAHSVDSSEMSFRAAGRLAFREAMEAASPVLLEPVSELVVTVPTELQGDVMGDLSSRRGRVSGTEPLGGGEVAVTALVPTAEVVRYAVDLRSLTGARGRFTARHHEYAPMPAHLAEAVAPRS